jgi:toxin ParE1/3/4
MKIALHPAAERDVTEAASFYEREGSPALAARFIAEFKRVSKMLLENPGFGAPRSGGRRSFSMNAFPYTVILQADVRWDKGFGLVKHDKRRPGYGGSRR